MKLRVCISEYGTSEPVCLTSTQLATLDAYSSFVEVIVCRTAGEYRLKADSFVGDLLLPGLVISVEPKIGPSNLLRLFLEGDGEATATDIFSPIRREDTLWDVLGNALMGETARLVQAGLTRGYLEEEANLQFPTGQVLFVQDFIKNTPIRNGIYCRHTFFTENISRNQALKWGLETLSQLASEDVAHRLTSATRWLQETDSLVNCPNFTLPDRTDRYFMPLYLITLLLRFTSAGTAAYGRHGQGYILDMNRVFEGYVRQQLRRRLSKHGICVVQKGERDRKLCDGVGLEPDLVLVNAIDGVSIAIADCKYKQNWDRQNNDVYQMLAYLEGYRPVETAIVLHPISKTEVDFKSIIVPRNRRLVSIGIPEKRLLDAEIWDSIELHMIQLKLTHNLEHQPTENFKTAG